MKPANSLAGRAIAIWLGAGILIGGLLMAALQSPPFGTSALAQRTVTGRNISDVSASGLQALKELDEAFAGVANYALGSVVHVRSENARAADSQGRFNGVIRGEGSGVIFRNDGYIITNDHVVNGFDKVTVTLQNGKEYPGKVIRGEDSDIAVVKIDAPGLNALPFADSEKVRPGQFAIAVGAPFGLESTVTVGHVSAVGRRSQVIDPSVAQQERFYPDMIQTDAAINMGNSGGPLINVKGEVIGINTAIYSHSGDNVGIGFAIPSNQVRLIAQILIDEGKIRRGYLGLDPHSLKEYQKKEMNLEGGALVGPFDSPLPSPAKDAGVKEGDVIVRVGAMPIRSEMDLRNSMLKYAPGETVKLDLMREGQRKTVSVKLTAPPKPPTQDLRQPQLRDFNGQDPMPDFEEWQRRFMQPRDETTPHTGPVRLGVTVEAPNETLRKQFSIPENVQGAVVTVVEPDSAASRIGMKSGDVILSFGGAAIKAPAELSLKVRGLKWGDSKSIKFARYAEGKQTILERDVKF